MVLDLTPSARRACKKWYPRRGPWRGLCGHNLAQGFEHTGADVARLNADSAERKNRGRQGDVPNAIEARRGQMRGKTAFYFGHSSPPDGQQNLCPCSSAGGCEKVFWGGEKTPCFLPRGVGLLEFLQIFCRGALGCGLVALRGNRNCYATRVRGENSALRPVQIASLKFWQKFLHDF